MAAHVVTSGEPIGADPVRLEPGGRAPDFSLADDHGATVTLSGLRGRRVVLYAYPAAMTPGCTTQACDFRDNLASMTSAGYTVLGLSPDSPDRLAEFRERDGLTYQLLSDPTHETLSAYGAYGEKSVYGKQTIGVIRSTFVLDEDGRVQRALYNVKATGHVEKLRRDLGV